VPNGGILLFDKILTGYVGINSPNHLCEKVSIRLCNLINQKMGVLLVH